jgi:alpha-D-ribose 1-methylphosphonate 5-triphosphate synthase subunit PhnH
LLDADTPTWLDGACAPAESWLAFHCGALLVAPAQASFAVACDMPALTLLHAGTDAAPETAATLVLQVTALGAGTNYGVNGPGLAAPGALRVRGLPADFVTQWRANHAQFPRGVDIILCAPDHIAALPRSVEIT